MWFLRAFLDSETVSLIRTHTEICVCVAPITSHDRPLFCFRLMFRTAVVEKWFVLTWHRNHRDLKCACVVGASQLSHSQWEIRYNNQPIILLSGKKRRFTVRLSITAGASVCDYVRVAKGFPYFYLFFGFYFIYSNYEERHCLNFAEMS